MAWWFRLWEYVKNKGNGTNCGRFTWRRMNNVLKTNPTVSVDVVRNAKKQLFLQLQGYAYYQRVIIQRKKRTKDERNMLYTDEMPVSTCIRRLRFTQRSIFFLFYLRYYWPTYVTLHSAIYAPFHQLNNVDSFYKATVGKERFRMDVYTIGGVTSIASNDTRRKVSKKTWFPLYLQTPYNHAHH